MPDDDASDRLSAACENDDFAFEFYALLINIARRKNSDEEIIINNDVVDLVNSSIIDDIPDVEPECMKRVYCIRSKSKMFGEVSEIYLAYLQRTVDEIIQYVALGTIGEGENTGGLECVFNVDYKNRKIIMSENRQTPFNEKAAKFLMTFAFLYNAENTPLIKKSFKEKITKIQRKNGKTGITKIYVTVDPLFIEKALGNVSVRGHLRNQACGVQWSERRIIYIAPFEYERMLIKKD